MPGAAGEVSGDLLRQHFSERSRIRGEVDRTIRDQFDLIGSEKDQLRVRRELACTPHLMRQLHSCLGEDAGEIKIGERNDLRQIDNSHAELVQRTYQRREVSRAGADLEEAQIALRQQMRSNQVRVVRGE